MPLTLEQYATYLDARDLTWPAAPPVEAPKAKPTLARLPEVRVVLWNVYGTLLSLFGGDLLFEHPHPFVMDTALDKTIHEFKMWNAMYRTPGPPTEQLRRYYKRLLDKQSMAAGKGTVPEVCAARLWEACVTKLFDKDYQFDTSFFGSLNEYCRKIAYFFHASLQGTACYPGAAIALRHVSGSGLLQGLLADGQSFTTVQLQRGLAQQDASANLCGLLDPALCVLSHELRVRKPSERLFRPVLTTLGQRGIRPEQVLHVGSRLQQDILPAKRVGMKTALFAGDKASLQATKGQINESLNRPDVLLTSLDQLAEVVG